MKKAAELLLTTKKTISDTAVSLGFTNRTHFYKIFQKHYQLTPAEYRKQLKK